MNHRTIAQEASEPTDRAVWRIFPLGGFVLSQLCFLCTMPPFGRAELKAKAKMRDPFCTSGRWGIVVCGLVNAGFALSVSIAAAAEIKSINPKGDSVEILISGTIASGDADLVAARIKAATDAGKLVSSVRLNSDGGNLQEGVRLAAIVRSAKLSTNVGQNATCASACFLVFAAGDTKSAYVHARIGVHGASEEGSESRKATAAMARIAEELTVPSSIIRRMVNTPPKEMTWLSLNDLRLMGADIKHYKNQ